MGCCNTGPVAPSSLGTAVVDNRRKFCKILPTLFFSFLHFQFFPRIQLHCLSVVSLMQSSSSWDSRDGLGTMHDPKKMHSGSASGSECPRQAESKEGSLHLPHPH